MDTKNLTDLDPATLAALAKTAAKAAKAARDSLEPGEYEVDTIVTLVLDAKVKVSEDLTDVSTPQKAKPWEIVHYLTVELNKLRAAAGMTGMDLAKVVAMAEKVDKELADKAQKEADLAMQALKEPTRQNRRGAVNVKGDAKLPA